MKDGVMTRWRTEQTRLAALELVVENFNMKGEKNPVTQGVREWTGMTVTEIAREIGEDRSDVSQCLGGRFIFHRIREKIGEVCGIPRGSFCQIMGLIEEG